MLKITLLFSTLIEGEFGSGVNTCLFAVTTKKFSPTDKLKVESIPFLISPFLLSTLFSYLYST